MESVQMTAHGRVNGMGETDKSGSYVAVSVNARFVRISEGAAEQLIAELQGALAQKEDAAVAKIMRDVRGV
jgi:hypothetical protein